MANLEQVYDILVDIQALIAQIPQSIRLTPQDMQINELSALTANLGLAQAGEFRCGNSVEPGFGFDGIRIAYPPMTYSASDWNIVGVDNDVIQFGVRASDGNLIAGAGAVTLNASGITATLGTIGGWVLGATSLADAAGVVGLSSAVTAGDDIRFWAGHATPASAPFRVTEAGALVASSATITGSVTATSGTIGGWTIDADEIKSLSTNVGITLYSTDAIIKVGDTAGVYIQIDGKNKVLQSSNFATGATGFSISADTGNAEFNNITSRGIIKTAVFEKATVSSVGGNLLILPSDKLATTMTAADNSTVTIEGNETFAVGDILRMKDDTYDEWLEVTNIGSAPTYTVTRDKAGAYSANANPAWKSGQAVVNYGAATKGGILLTSSMTNAPFIQGFVTGATPWSGITEKFKLGNLNGSYGLSSETYGVGLGEYGASKSSVRIDDTNGISLFSGTTERVGITPAGVVTIKNSSGNAVFTFDGSAGAEFTLPLTLAATGGIYQGTGTFASPTTGLKIWNDGGVGRIAGYNATVAQWYANTDGILYAGAGKVSISTTGIQILGRHCPTIAKGGGNPDAQNINFLDPEISANLISYITGYTTHNVGETVKSNMLQIGVNDKDGYDSYVRVEPWASGSKISNFNVYASNDSSFASLSCSAAATSRIDIGADAINITGPLTATLVAESVTYAMMQHVSATDKILGRATAGAGDVEEIVCTAAGRAILDDATAAAQLATIGGVPLQPAADITINDSGGDFNIIIEGDTNANLFTLDAGADVISIAAAAVASDANHGKLQVTGVAGQAYPAISAYSDTIGGGIYAYNSVAEGSGSGGRVGARASFTPSATNMTMGALAVGAITTGTTYVNAGSFRVRSAEAWGAASAGVQVEIMAVPTGGSTTQMVALRLAPTSSTAVTYTWADASSFVLGTTTGLKIGTATNQKLAFFNATPVVQQAHISDPSGGTVVDSQARTAINALIARLETFGLIATS